jgi:hypothetical protein
MIDYAEILGTPHGLPDWLITKLEHCPESGGDEEYPKGVHRGWLPSVAIITESMWGPEQTPYIYAWLQWAYRAYEERSLAPGQLLVIVGPNNCGKTLYQEKVISALLGSTSAKCLKYLMDRTEFNSDLISNCHWVLSDSISDLNYQQRKMLTEACERERKIQNLVAWKLRKLPVVYVDVDLGIACIDLNQWIDSEALALA